MRTWQRGVAAGTAGLLAIGGYLTLDVLDHVPGFLTTEDAAREPVALPGQTAPPTDVRRPGAPAPVAAAAVPAGPMPDPAKLRSALAPLLRGKGLGPTTSVAIRDGVSGTHLLDVDADGAHTPASITKLLTAYAVLRTMNPAGTLDTTAVSGADGRVVLVAGGDTALAPDRGNPDEVAGHAGLGDLATQVAAALKKQGRTTVAVDWDLSYAPGPLQATNWEQGVVDQGFTTRIGMLGLATDRSDPGHAPPLNPARNAAQAMVKALAARGITATVGAEAKAPAGAERLGIVRSASLLEVVGLAMRDSDNAMTESLGRQGAAQAGQPGETASVVAWVMSVLRADGIDLRGVKLMDLSGLSDGTTIPARVTSDLLVRATTGQSKAYQELLSRLPVGGWNGTLHNRFQVAGAIGGAGYARAKTGSLPGVSSLAGTVVSRDGRVLVFTVINNGAQPRGPLAARADIDRIVTALGACGCR